MSEHTPGRWLVQKSRKGGWRVYGEEAGGTVIALPAGWTDEERRANAHLISAAPELLHEARREE